MHLVNLIEQVLGGVRGEDIRGTNAGGFFGDQSRHMGAVAANAAVTWVRESCLVTAQAARGFRDPTLTERFSRGPVGRGFLEGNPALEPETSVQFDVTARYTREVEAVIRRYPAQWNWAHRRWKTKPERAPALADPATVA